MMKAYILLFALLILVSCSGVDMPDEMTEQDVMPDRPADEIVLNVPKEAPNDMPLSEPDEEAASGPAPADVPVVDLPVEEEEEEAYGAAPSDAPTAEPIVEEEDESAYGPAP